MYDMNIRVRYSETDISGKLRLSHILDYFQDVATFHSMALNLDAGGDLVSGHGWYLLSWDVSIYRCPGLGETVHVITEPYKMKGFYGYRRFYLKDQEGQLLAGADSIWVLMDLEKRIPVRISEDLTRRFVEPGTEDTIRVKRKLPAAGNWEKIGTMEVTDIFLDTNMHVNNAFYVQWACMILPPGSVPVRLKADYRQSARKGDMLYLYHYMEGDIFRVKYTNQEDVLIAMIDLHTKPHHNNEYNNS